MVRIKEKKETRNRELFKCHSECKYNPKDLFDTSVWVLKLCLKFTSNVASSFIVFFCNEPMNSYFPVLTTNYSDLTVLEK